MEQMVSQVVKEIPDRQFTAKDVMEKIGVVFGNDAISNGLCEVASVCTRYAMDKLASTQDLGFLLEIDRSKMPFIYTKAQSVGSITSVIGD